MPKVTFIEEPTRQENEQSLFDRGVTPEEVEMLSDIEVLALLIAERKTKISRDQSTRMASVRRRRS